MQFRPKNLRGLFQQYKDGQADALNAFLAAERDRLYDYVLRMTGQVSRAYETTDETMLSIESGAGDCETMEEFLTLLYKTARKYAADVWNADTSRLENEVYSRHSSKDAQSLLRLEKVVRMLPAPQREALLLRERLGFAMDEVAEIMGIPTPEVEQIFAEGLGTVEDALPDLSKRVPEMFVSVPQFTAPEPEELQTKNLSLIMQDFRKSSGSGISRGPVVGLILLLILIAAFAWQYWDIISSRLLTH